MGRYERRRTRRGAHRAEPSDSGALATVGQVLGSTVPKKVAPPRPLRVLVLSGVVVGLVLFSYSTTQIYLRFADPAPVPPGAAEADLPAPAPTGTEAAATRQPVASGRTEITVEGLQEQVEEDDDEDAVEPEPVADTGRPQVSYQMTPYGGGDFMGTVTITNTSDRPMDDWELRLGFADAKVVSAWEADWEETSDGLVARRPSWAGGIAPGQSVSVYFTARGGTPTPRDCSLNGNACGL